MGIGPLEITHTHRPLLRALIFATLIALAVSPLGASSNDAASAPASGFDEELYQAFLDLRIGTGEPVYWYSIGTVYSYPDGKELMTLEGFDTARRHRLADPHSELQLSRKVFVYRDLKTNEVLETYDGNPVSHIQYPYQQIKYTLLDTELETWVTQGAGERVQKIGPGKNTKAKRIGDLFFYHSPLFLDFPTPSGGRYQAFENYDFFTRKGSANTDVLSWIRYGDRPPWAGEGKTIIHLVSWRVDRYQDLPNTIRTWIDENARAWRQPPRDLAEIESMQQGNFDPNP